MIETAESPPPPPVSRSRRLAVVSASIVLLAAAAAAIASRGTGTPNEFLLRHSFESGETRTYDYTFSMTLPEQTSGVAGLAGPMTMHGTVTYKVVETFADGSASIEYSLSNLTMKGMPAVSPAPAIPAQTFRMRVARDGHVVSIQGTNLPQSMTTALTSATDPATGSNLFPLFPDHRVEPGDEWSREVDVPMLGQTSHVTVSSKHDGFEDTKFGRAVRLRQTMTIPYNSATIPLPTALPGGAPAMSGSSEMTSVSLVLPADGQVVKSVMDMTQKFTMKMPAMPSGGARLVPGDMDVTSKTHVEMLRLT